MSCQRDHRISSVQRRQFSVKKIFFVVFPPVLSMKSRNVYFSGYFYYFSHKTRMKAGRRLGTELIHVVVGGNEPVYSYYK